MRLLIIRHAPAGDADEFVRSGLDDDLRPITSEGRALMRPAAEGLVRSVPHIDRLISSPLLRAVQTAEIVTAVFDRLPIEESNLLRPGASIDAFPRFLNDVPADAVVAIVGHRPHLHQLASWLLTAEEGNFLVIKKGGALMLKFPARRGLKRGLGKLEWSLTPEQLGWIGRPGERAAADAPSAAQDACEIVPSESIDTLTSSPDESPDARGLDESRSPFPRSWAPIQAFPNR